jgi:hypothetical protein
LSLDVAPLDSGTTNIWLTVIAVASIAQLLLLLIISIAVYRFYRQTARQIEVFHQQQLDPAIRRLQAVLDEASDVLERVKAADDDVRHVLDRTSATVQRVASVAGSRVWPVIGLIRGVRAAVASLSGRSRPRLESRMASADVRMRS